MTFQDSRIEGDALGDVSDRAIAAKQTDNTETEANRQVPLAENLQNFIDGS